MKIFKTLFIPHLAFFSLISQGLLAETEDLRTSHENNAVNFAENVLFNEFMLLRNETLAPNNKNKENVSRGTLIEMSFSLLMLSDSIRSQNAILNSLALKLDAGGSESRSCDILFKGDSIKESLKDLAPKKIIENCQARFEKFSRSRKSLNINSDDICQSENEIYKLKEELLDALNGKRQCE